MRRAIEKIDALSKKIDMLKFNPTLCSFCGKSRAEVTHLISGPMVNICNDCVDMCVDIIKKDTKEGIK